MVSKACREEKTKLVSDRAIRDLTDQLRAMDIDHEGGMCFCKFSLVHIDMLLCSCDCSWVNADSVYT